MVIWNQGNISLKWLSEKLWLQLIGSVFCFIEGKYEIQKSYCIREDSMGFRSKGTCQKQDGNVNWCHHVTATCFHIHVIMFTICVMCHAIIACFSRVMASVTYKELYWKPKHSLFAPSKKIQNQVTIDKRIISLNLLHTWK